MSIQRRIHYQVAISLALALPLAGSAAWAGTMTWTGTGNWTNATRWGGTVPGTGDTAVIQSGTVTLTNSVQVLNLTNSGTISFNGWSNVALTASNVVVLSGGVITHGVNTSTVAPWTPNAGVFIACTTLTVQAGGAINGDGMGYGGQASATGYGPGGGICYNNRGGGGGYGGAGGLGSQAASYGGPTYGAATNPVHPGSAGGGGNGGVGMAGGGYVQIAASGTVTVDGLISMNGSNSVSYVGYGAGGGILIQCGNLAGGGTIRAEGGAGGYEAGGGGGGRIAIYATTPSSFSGQLSAKHGNAYYTFPDNARLAAGPGTIYLSDWGILPGSLTNGGAARFMAGTGTAASVTISNYTLHLEWGWETNRLKAGTVTVQNSGKIMHVWNTTATTNGSGQWEPNAGIFIECSNLTVQAGGEINGSGMGYGPGTMNANGRSPGGGVCGNGRGGGAGYGGAGGRGEQTNSLGGPTYGSVTNPASPGSGGGGANGASYLGGGGGGYVKIVASGTVAVEGLIAANGNNSASYAGGGSGGAIYLQGASLTGSGLIQANAGQGSGGGGGGGRIAIYMTNPSPFNGQLSAKNGAGLSTFPDADRLAPVPGTIYLSDWGILPAFLTNGGAARFMAGTGTAASVTISNYTLFLEWGWETNRLKAGTVTVQNSGKIMHVWNMAATTNGSGQWEPNAGIFIECSNLTVETEGAINGDGMGYGGNVTSRGCGPGGGYCDNNRGGGGGYGGVGGKGEQAGSLGGPTYGSSNNPASPGSGGGGGNFTFGKSGGGYVKIAASGTVVVNGTISMNGLDGGSYVGNGSGGGILIQCGSLIGNGTIRANGGNGGSGNGGGGGGRIALLVRNAPFYTGGNILSTPTVTGGTGLNPGGPGTIYYDLGKPRGTMFSAW